MSTPWRQLFMTLLVSTTVWLTVVLISSSPLIFQHEPVPEIIPSPKPTGVHEGDRKSAEFWRKLDVQYLTIAQDVKLKSNSVHVEENSIYIEGTKVFYRRTRPLFNVVRHPSVLLLHGAAFSSKTWVVLGTMQVLAALGYYTVAIDIPGFGRSPKTSIRNNADFLYELINKLQLNSPVIISPSMSGNYAMPYILKYWNVTSGFVPVSPVSTHLLSEDPCGTKLKAYDVFKDGTCGTLKDLLHLPIANLSCLKIPTLVVYGEHDIGRNSAILCQLPWSQAVEIPKGKHPAYLDNPELWHQILYNFVSQVNLMLS